MSTKAYEQVEKMLLSPSVKIVRMARVLLSPTSSMEEKLRAWHTAMGAVVRTSPTIIPLNDVDRRLRLTLEEFRETIKGSGFTIVSKETGKDIFNDLKLIPLEHGEEDLVEIADGIADVIVVNLGHAIEHGLPITEIFNEVMLSNGTKLPEDGVALVNKCISRDSDPTHLCDSDSSICDLLDNTAPLDKILKPREYCPPDISAVLNKYINLNK